MLDHHGEHRLRIVLHALQGLLQGFGEQFAEHFIGYGLAGDVADDGMQLAAVFRPHQPVNAVIVERLIGNRIAEVLQSV